MSLSYTYPKGRVHSIGFFFDDALPSMEVKNRILTLWSPSSKVYKSKHGFILLFQETVTVYLSQSLGAPLIKQFGGFSNVLWQSSLELSSCGSHPVVWLLKNGRCESLELCPELEFNPSEWLDLSHYSEVKLETLGVIKTPEIKARESKKSVRNVLNDKGLDESPELIETLEKLGDRARKGYVDHGERSGAGFSALFSSVKKLFASSAASGRGGSGGTGGNASRYSAQQPGVTSRGLIERLRHAFSHFVMSSALGKAIGKAQAKYVQKMMDEFDGGDIDAALRNAIPLSNIQDALQSQGASLGRISGHMSTSIQPYAQGGSGSVNMEEELLSRLRTMYEVAFTKMDRAGNYKKAAFILAELLRDIDRAVAYLEKHEQYDLAAELAEGQNLSPARIVRQWILAKKIDRAMHVAVVSGCYEEAVTALEKLHPKEADMLRWQCAELHYRGGNINRAADIAWPISEKRSTVLEWMKESVSLGGAVGARHLVRLAVHDAEHYDEYLVKIDALLREDSPKEHLALYDEIVTLGDIKPNKRIASIASRHYLIEVAKGNLKHDAKRWNRLCFIAEDLTLRADVRNLGIGSAGKQTMLFNLAKPKEMLFGESHGRQAEDCTVLCNGQILVAFGESGVEHWSGRGKLLSRYAIPCHKIVVSDEGTAALFVAERSGYQVVHKIDVKSRVTEHWLDLTITKWADCYDGNTWLVGRDDIIFALDVHSSEQNALWSVGKLPGTVNSIKRSLHCFTFCLATEESFELWTYQLPNLYLKERSPYKQQNLKDFYPVTLRDDGIIAGTKEDDRSQFGIFCENGNINWNHLDVTSEPNELELLGRYLYAVTAFDDSVSLHVCPVQHLDVKPRVLSVRFEGAGHLLKRAQGDLLLIHHSDGRVLVVDVGYGEVVSDFVL